MSSFHFGTVHDISVTIGRESVTFPGDPPPVIEPLASFAHGDDYELSRLSLSLHTGTHLDAPAHFTRDGPTIGAYAAGYFVMPAILLPVAGPVVEPESLVGADLNPGEAVLFRTDNSQTGLSHSGELVNDYVHLSPAAAAACVERRLRLVGIDYFSVDAPSAPDYPVHRILLSAGVLILEGLNLSGVAPGRYTLFCLPLKLEGVEASPVRAVLLG